MAFNELHQLPPTQDLAELSTTQSRLSGVEIDHYFTPESRSKILEALPGTTLDYCIAPEESRPVQTVYMGRDSDSDIKVMGGDISRVHVAVTVERAENGKLEYVRVTNQEPTNGTLFNGRRMDFNQQNSGRADLMDFSVIGLAPGETETPKMSYILFTVGNSLQVCQIAYTKETKAKLARAQSDKAYAKELKLSLLAAAHRDSRK